MWWQRKNDPAKAGKQRVAPAAIGPAAWQSGNAPGVLKVILERATNLPSADSNGLSDPYVVLHCGKEKKKSKIIYKNLNPVWDESFEFNGTLDEFVHQGLHLKVGT